MSGADELPTMQKPRGATPEAPPSFVVSVVEGPDRGTRFELDARSGQRVLVGTGPACQIKLSDREVSRRHAAFQFDGAELHLEDLGSTNGTRVSGVQALQVILHGGETIQLGSSSLSLERRQDSAPLRLSAESSFGRLVGASVAMRRLYPLCERLARSEVPVLIEGETGTGKELLAEALHERGARADKPFVVFDCSAVTPSLVESHLFGHERGAFTGATGTRRGVFELADGGSLFIDEIGDLELALQARLLRAIERGEVCRVGAERWRKVDVRIVAATRRDLDKDVQSGRFRDDLFFRLAVARIELPPLRRRHGDVALLARHFWDQLGGRETPIPYALFESFEDYAWPGNVRELFNAVARNLALGDLAEFEAGQRDSSADAGVDAMERILARDLPLPRAKQALMAEFERRYVDRVLARYQGDAGEASKASGIARRYFNLLRARHAARE